MITKTEVSTLNLSPTKKDFAQIWNELIEVAGKLSERWDPTSTNESDPGIVLLKALAGIADKLNYNIDKNTLEAFMPTAAQEESMRKLCEMMGYNIKYLRSAVTTVNIKYHNTDPSDEEAEAIKNGLAIPSFTVIKNSDGDVSYFTTNPLPVYISATTPNIVLECMEGQIVQCESLNDNNVITYNQLSSDNRFYLPEIQIAENGIFVYNVARLAGDPVEFGAAWKRVENLNTQKGRSRVFKFGYDSYLGRPYIEFPDDISELIGDGLFIYYTRTSGENGNVAARTLTQIEVPTAGIWSSVSQDSFTVENITASTTGANIESIESAYKNFKKTIGTFDTLVTCRDYMNGIYNMMSSDNKPLVSNVLVTDIRNDLNKAITICSCSDAGICYKEKPLSTLVHSDVHRPVFINSVWQLCDKDGPILTPTDLFNGKVPKDFNKEIGGIVTANENGFWDIIQTGVDANKKPINRRFTTKLRTFTTKQDLMDHFDLTLYPFKSYNQIRSNIADIGAVYDSSFKYSERNLPTIISRLKGSQTIAHKYVKPNVGDILSINNYLRLNAFIATTNKITADEGAIIIDNIKIALANAFNMRELDFGEEIPFEQILAVIERADPRIKVASLTEPTLYTTYSVLGGYSGGNPKVFEYATASEWLTGEEAAKMPKFVDTEVPYKLSSASFFAESTGDGYKIYTIINNNKKYLTVRVVSTGRTNTDEITPFLVFDDEGITWQNKAYKISSSKTINAWTYTYDTKHSYFLGAYGNNCERITLSNTEYLNSLNITTEYPAEFTKTANIKNITQVSTIVPEIERQLENNISYKLFIQNTSLIDKIPTNPKAVFYALSETSENKKHLLTTDIPESDKLAYKQRYLFNTKTAKTIYNKLAVRNILAGRIPLFNYHEVFKTDFTEAPYRITIKIDSLPKDVDGLKEQFDMDKKHDNYPSVFVAQTKDKIEDIVIYTMQKITNDSGKDDIIYTKTYTPFPTFISGKTDEEIYELFNKLEIAGTPEEATEDESDQTPDDTTKPENPDSENINKEFSVTDVELPEGQVIKFRAPNFITTKTFPAYVNYHLQLLNKETRAAKPAQGDSLLNILNADLSTYNFSEGTDSKTNINWEKAFKYFSAKQVNQANINSLKTTDENIKNDYLKSFTIYQEIDGFNPDKIDDSWVSFCSCKNQPDPTKTEVWATLDEKGHLTCPTCGLKSVDQYIQSNKAPQQPGASNGPGSSFTIKAEIPGSTDNDLELEDILRESGIARFKTFNSKDIENLEEIKLLSGNAKQKAINNKIISTTTAHHQSIKGIRINFVPKNKDIAADVAELNKFNEHFSLYINIDYAKGVNGQQSPYIVSAETVYSIMSFVEQKIGYWKQCKYKPEGASTFRSVLPKCPWRVELQIEYIPVNKFTLAAWQDFLITNKNDLFFKEDSVFANNKTSGAPIFIVDNNNIFWRKYTGYNYDIGRAVGKDFAKYLPFERTTLSSMNFDSIPGNTFILGDMGMDGEATKISNGAEYELKDGEHLYINYTPSSTDAEGKSDKAEPKNLVFGRGTIIRPSGFETGLIDSTYKEKQGTSWTKRNNVFTLTDPKDNQKSNISINLHSLGANEQIEIRDWAQTTLNRKTLNNNPNIFIYKNFDQKELEAGSKNFVQYTLKEKEYIFYTDQNKSDAGYFSEGTTVTLLNRITIPRADKIELGTILDSGLSCIPWTGISLDGNKAIQFTEYQYFTLGEGDTLVKAQVAGPDPRLTDKWQPCVGTEIQYTLASDTEEPKTVKTLPAIKVTPLDPNMNLPNNAYFNGWEICCAGELNVSPNVSQTLTSIFDGVKQIVSNGLIYKQSGAGGALDKKEEISVEKILADKNIDNTKILKPIPSITFKTNVLCQGTGNKIDYSEIPNNLRVDQDIAGFAFKVFTKQPPMIVKTIKNKPFPYIASSTETIDIAQGWRGTEVATKDPNDVWSRISLDNIKVGDTNPTESTGMFDRALKLSAFILPKTYGIASLYTNYTSSMLGYTDTWIEIPAGYAEDDFIIINAASGKNYWNIYAEQAVDRCFKSGQINRLYLFPGLNCIRLKKSCDLLIKTSINSQGEFYFDALRLVKIENLPATNEYTQGLNLKQIGYFYTGDPIDEENDKIYTGSDTILREQQLLRDIKNIDLDRDFYYNVPVESSVAIELNNKATIKDTLQNPQINYDINNVNNPFVISKLDIDYLDTGLQIARSSKLN